MKTLSELLNESKEETVQKYLEKNTNILIEAFTDRWSVTGCFPKFKFGSEFISDFVIVAGQSYSYNIILIELEPPTENIFNQNGKYANRLNGAMGQVNDWLSWIHDNEEYFKKSISKKFENSYNEYSMQPQFMHRIFVTSKIIIGKRGMLSSDDNKRRATLFAQTNKTLEIVPYDRLVDIEKKLTTKHE